VTRFYEPVAIQNNERTARHHYAIRAVGGAHRHRTLGIGLGLSHRAADLLCDLLEEVREVALEEGVED
jgi:hypothetical protein